MRESLRISTLGGVSIHLNEQPVTGFNSRKVEALLIYLAYTEKVHPREVLAEFFWPDRSRTQSLANLRGTLKSLRDQLDPFVCADRHTVCMNPDTRYWLDAGEFLRCLKAIDEPLSAPGTVTPQVVTQLEQTTALYRGDFLEGFFIDDSPAFDDWLLVEREHLRMQAQEMLDTLVVVCAEQGNFSAGITHATRLLQMDPIREETYRALMGLLAQSGQRTAALAQYESCQRMLAEEFGAEPTAETKALYEQILAGEIATTPRAITVTVPTATLRNPYKGLRPFQEADAGDFFGREALVQRLLGRMRDTRDTSRFLAVVGPSGSGKSSVVRAGLIPALRSGALPGSERWIIALMMPGSHPMEELEAALLRQAVNPPPSLMEQLQQDSRGLLRAVKRVLVNDEQVELLLIVDQFEELFSLVRHEDTRVAFLDRLVTALCEPRSRLRVLVTLRADFYDHPLLYTQLGSLIREQTEVVLPLLPDELERAVVGPAEQVGLNVDTGLLTTMVADVMEQPGALPLLQYALTEMVERRDDSMLTLDGYHAIGGVQGALSQRADALYRRLDTHGQELVRQVFLRLVQLGEEAAIVRRRVPWKELASVVGGEATTQVLLMDFITYRLLTVDLDPVTGESTVELAHDAITQAWGQLRGWVTEARSDIRLQRQLAAACAEWERANREDSYLLYGVRLAQFENWAETTTISLTQEEQDFLAVSTARYEHQLAEERARQQRELEIQSELAEQRRRAANRLRTLVAVLAVFLVVAVGLSLLTLSAFSTAEDERDKVRDAQAETQRRVVELQQLFWSSIGNQALAYDDKALALRMMVEANQGNALPPFVHHNLANLVYAPGLVRRTQVSSGFPHPSAITLSADGNLAIISPIELMSNESSWSQAYRTYAEFASNYNLALWDLTAGQKLATLPLTPADVSSAAISPDGQHAVFGTHAGKLIQMDIATCQLTDPFGDRDFVSTIQLVAFSPDGQTLLVATLSGDLWLVDANTGQRIRRIGLAGAPVTAVAFSRDGQTALSSVPVGRFTIYMFLWDLNTGELIRSYRDNRQSIDTIAVSPDGQKALSASIDGTLFLWNIALGGKTQLLSDHMGWISAAAFHPDGEIAALGASDGGVIVWDLAAGEPILRYDEHSSSIFGLAFTRDGRRLVSTSVDGTQNIFDITYGPVLNTFREHNDHVTDVAVRAMPQDQGHVALSASRDNKVILWDLERGEVLKTFFGHTSWVHAVGFSPNGQFAVSGSRDKTLILWDLETGEALHTFTGHKGWIHSVAFSPTGDTVLSASSDQTLILWDVESGIPLRQLEGHTGRINSVAFSPDGRTALSGSDDMTVRLWNIETGTLIRTFTGHTDNVNCVAFGPDGRSALSGASDGTLILWDIASGESEVIRAPEGPIYSAVFSPDGRTVLSTSGNTLILWDLAERLPLSVYYGHTGQINTVAISPDGNVALSGSRDHSLILWEIHDTAEELVAWTLANREVRDLTCEERALYRVPPMCE